MAGILDNPYMAQAYQLSQSQPVLPQAQPQGFFNNLAQTGALTNLGLALMQSGANGESLAQGISKGANAAVGSINNFRAQQEQKSQNQINNLLKFGEMDIKAQDLERDSFYRQAALGLQQQQLGMQLDKVNQEKRAANSRAKAFGNEMPYPEAENYSPKAFEPVLPQEVDNASDAVVNSVLQKDFGATDEMTLEEDAQGNIQPVTPQQTPVVQSVLPQSPMQTTSNPVLGGQSNGLMTKGLDLTNLGARFGDSTVISAGGKMIDIAQSQPEFKGAQQEAETLGKSRGEDKAAFESIVSKMPELNKNVSELRDLANKATYTKVGGVLDTAAKEVFGQTTEGSLAATKYQAKIDNQILPLLKQTFGSQFTVAEGENLKATLGKPDMSPEQKQATLDAFVQQKINDINSNARRFGVEVPNFSLEQSKVPTLKIGTVKGGYTYIGGDPANPNSWSK